MIKQNSTDLVMLDPINKIKEGEKFEDVLNAKSIRRIETFDEQRMIIDFHQHLVLNPLELKKIMLKNRIVKAITMPFDLLGFDWKYLVSQNIIGMSPKSTKYVIQLLSQLWNINKKTCQLIKQDLNFVFVPWLSVLNEGQDIYPQDAKIVKFIPILDDVTHDYWRNVSAIVKSIEAKIIMFHTGWGAMLSDDQIHGVSDFIAELSDKIIILAHMKEDTDEYNKNRVELLEKFDNVYCETSYAAGPHRIKQYIDNGYENRLLFGSDFRFREHVPFLKWQIQMIELAEINESMKHKIFYENAKQLLKRGGI